MSHLAPLARRAGPTLIRRKFQHCVTSSYLLLPRHASNSTTPASPSLKKPPGLIEPKITEEQAPQPLSRPLGDIKRPEAGQNDGVDPRNWGQRRDDFLNYDKHLARRAELTKKVAKPYFRDWSNLRFHKGKTFIAPKTLIRAEMALYFPNIRGVTLAEPHDEQDTTTALEGRISIICVFTGTWAQVQTASFTDNNEKLRKILKAGKGLIQRADLNVEDNTMKAGLIRMFMGGIRRKLPENRHGRYFLVRRGFEDDMRKNIGIFNNQVGYVYLVDSECRIRWAGCAEADQEEIESLLRGVKRLVQELKQKRAEETKADEEYGVKLVGDIYDAVTSIVE